LKKVKRGAKPLKKEKPAAGERKNRTRIIGNNYLFSVQEDGSLQVK
jgi:hypothetical protein